MGFNVICCHGKEFTRFYMLGNIQRKVCPLIFGEKAHIRHRKVTHTDKNKLEKESAAENFMIRGKLAQKPHGKYVM